MGQNIGIFAGISQLCRPVQNLAPFRSGVEKWRLFHLPNKRGYHYKPLRDGEIRLLHLLPGSPKEIVRCSLNRVRLSDVADNYEALSYAWGDPHRKARILCSGMIKDVTVSLHEALKHLRYEDKPRYLWADALCINQNHVEERNQQVQHMGDIYASAQKVLIWLGPETSEVEGSLENLPAWLQYETPAIDWKAANVKWSSSSSFTFNSEGLSSDEMAYLRYQQSQLPAISHLFARPWWRRRWVIQEQAKAKDASLVCGNSSIPWVSVQQSSASEDNINGIYQLLKRIEDTDLSRAALNGFWNSRTLTFLASKVKSDDNKRSHSLRLPGTLDWARNFDCSDPRDNLYSLLPIAKDLDENLHRPLVKVDYLDSVACLSIRLSEYLMRTAHRPLWHFSYAMGTRQPFDADQAEVEAGHDQQQEPSWACSFLHPSYPTRHDLHIQLCFFNFDAGKVDTHKAPAWKLSPNKRVLSVKGSIIGEITELIGPRLQPDSNYTDLAAWGRMVWNTATNLPTTYGSQTPTDLFYELATSDGAAAASMKEETSIWEKPTLEAADNFRRWIQQRDESNLEEPNSEIRDFAEAMQLALCRQLCITSTGHLGFFPPHAMVGDKICVFPGDKLLHVIGSCGQGHYNLIGDCYVKGQMWGEALDLGLEEQWIRLY